MKNSGDEWVDIIRTCHIRHKLQIYLFFFSPCHKACGDEVFKSKHQRADEMVGSLGSQQSPLGTQWQSFSSQCNGLKQLLTSSSLSLSLSSPAPAWLLHRVFLDKVFSGHTWRWWRPDKQIPNGLAAIDVISVRNNMFLNCFHRAALCHSQDAASCCDHRFESQRDAMGVTVDLWERFYMRCTVITE